MSDVLPWIIALCGIAVLLYVQVLKWRTNRERRLATVANRFYEELDLLLKDTSVPEAVLDLIDFLNRVVTDRSLARHIFFSLLLRRAYRDSAPVSTGFEEVVMSYYLNERKELTNHFIGACVAAIFAVSYQSSIFGILLRRLVFFDLNKHRDRAPDVVASLRARSIGSHNHCAAAA